MFLSLKIILPLLILPVIMGGCSRTEYEVESESAIYLETIVKISIYDSAPEGVFNRIFTLIQDFENKFSRNIPESEISAINSNSGKNGIPVSEDTFNLIKKGLEYSKISGGKFDLSIGPLVSLWGIGTENAKVPPESEIIKTLKLTDYRKIELDKNSFNVGLADKNMEIDCGAIAKGYIADRTADLLKSEGVKSAIINLGGNILTIGSKPDGTPFRIGIQDPSDVRGEYIGIVTLIGKSIVTSGIYERYFEENGERYHHILDTDTGYPVINRILGISVITDKSVDGDALSTTLYTMGVEKGLIYAGNDKDIEVLYVTDENEIHMSEGFKDHFNLKSSKYSVVAE
jgi:thiamine biosynthesis lipoprotein